MDYDYNVDLDSVRILTHNRWGKRISRPDNLDEHDVRRDTGKVMILFWAMNMDGFINSKFPFCRIYSDHILSGIHLDSGYLMKKERLTFRRYPYSYVIAK